MNLPRPNWPVKPLYRKVECDSGIYIYPDIENAADGIHFRSHSKTLSHGYGGRKISFDLIDGTIINLQGPWHTNPYALFNDTGIDLRDKHYTFGMIGTKWVNLDKITDLIYTDNEWKLGRMDRIDKIAQELLNQYGELYYYVESMGGTRTKHVRPVERNTDPSSFCLSPEQLLCL